MEFSTLFPIRETELVFRCIDRQRSPDQTERPRFITELCDQNVEVNGTLSLQVEVKGELS